MSEEKVSLKGTQALPADSWGVTNQSPGQSAPPLWDVPVTEVALPSGGKVYPVDSPLHNRETIEIRSMTAREEDILTSRVLLRQGKAMSQLLKNCIVDKSINPEEMITGDRNAILVAIRVSGYGAEYETKIECPECNASFDHVFNLGQIPLVKLGQDPEAEGANIFSFTLPMSKRVARFRLLTGAEERELTVLQERTRKALGPEAPETNVTSRLFHQIISIDGEEDRTKLQRLVNTMSAGDSRALRKKMDEIAPGLDMTKHISCKACGEESEVGMPLGAEFFWPGL